MNALNVCQDSPIVHSYTEFIANCSKSDNEEIVRVEWSKTEGKRFTFQLRVKSYYEFNLSNE